MIEPVDRILHRLDRRHGRQRRPAKHDDRNAKSSRRGDLAVGRGAAAILAHNELGAMLLQQSAFIVFREWAARRNVGHVGHGERRLDWINAADDIVMLRSGGERRDILASDSEKHLAWHVSERADRAGDIVDVDPSVAGDLSPRWPSQCQNFSSCSCGGIGRMVRHDGGVGMGCVDQHIDMLRGKVVGEAVGAAKTSDPHRHRLGGRLRRAAGKRQRHAEISTVRKPSSQLPGLDGTSEYENMPHAAR